MDKLMIVGAGGFLGAIARFALSGLTQAWGGDSPYPYGTMLVNLIGCFCIGVLTQVGESRGFPSPEMRAFLGIGLLGGFTTYSTFGIESLQLLRDGQSTLALVFVGGHLFFGLLAAWLGVVVAYGIWR